MTTAASAGPGPAPGPRGLPFLGSFFEIRRDPLSFKGMAATWAKPVLGEGLITSEGAHHTRQRRLIQPAFHRQRIRAYGETMVRCAERRRDAWRSGQEIDVCEEMGSLSMDVVVKTLFDTEVETEAREVGQALTTIMDSFPRYNLPFARTIRFRPFRCLPTCAWLARGPGSTTRSTG